MEYKVCLTEMITTIKSMLLLTTETDISISDTENVYKILDDRDLREYIVTKKLTDKIIVRDPYYTVVLNQTRLLYQQLDFFYRSYHYNFSKKQIDAVKKFYSEGYPAKIDYLYQQYENRGGVDAENESMQSSYLDQTQKFVTDEISFLLNLIETMGFKISQLEKQK